MELLIAAIITVTNLLAAGLFAANVLTRLERLEKAVGIEPLVPLAITTYREKPPTSP